MIATSKRSGWNVIESTSTNLNRRNTDGKLWGTHHPEIDPPASGIFLGMAPHAPPANAVFSEQELNARIERYAAKYADSPRCGCVCWCCGVRTTRNTVLTSIGWHQRRVKLAGTIEMVEVYCGECFAEWGWPEEPE